MRKIFSVIQITALLILIGCVLSACTMVDDSDHEPLPMPLAAPVVRLDGDLVSWSAVDKAASYDVYVNGGKVKNTEALQYNVEATSAGDYEVKIKAVPADENYAESDFSNAVTYTVVGVIKLATPVISGRAGIIEWNEVENADSYDVYLRGENMGTTKMTWYVMPELDDGNYEIKVMARSTNPAYSDSDFGVYTYRAGEPLTTPLTAPVILLDGKVVKWNAVTHADSYDVYVNDALTATVETTSYTLNYTEYGKYAVIVIAKSDDEQYTNSLPSNQVVYEIKRPKLTAPDISLKGNVVSWTAITGATSYEIYINNMLRTTVPTTTYTISVTVGGTYNIKIKAIGAGYDSSEYSNTVEYKYEPPKTPLAAPFIELDGNVISWVSVAHATSYKIYVNDAPKTTVTASPYTITDTEPGRYTIKVRAVPSDSLYSESELSNGVVYILASPNAQPIGSPSITITDKTVSWSAVDDADVYDVYADGVLLGSTKACSYSLESIVTAGEYSITVVAQPEDFIYHKSSLPSAPQTYTVEKIASHIAITRYPTKEIYFTDEAATGLDLSGIEAALHYSNYDTPDPITLTAADAYPGSYDLAVPGRYEIEFVKNGIASDAVRIYVRERTVDDISDYIIVVNEYKTNATEYAVTDSSFAPTMAYTASGAGFAVTDGKVAAAALKEGENLVRLSDGSVSKYALVKIARIILTADDFKAIEDALDGYYMLGADIDFAGNGFMIGSAPLLIEWEAGGEAEKKAAKVYSSRDGVGCADAPGELFTGTLDGCGYILKNFSFNAGGGGGYSQRWRTSGVALFGGVGKTGIIRNLVLRDFHIKSTGASALLAGYNAGLIENICIEEDCSVGYHWDAAVGISVYNYGIVRNCVSNLTTVDLDRTGGTKPMYLTHFGGSEYEVDNGVNGYVGATEDLSDILGDGWYFVPGFGMYYGNIEYKKVIYFESVWYANVPSRVVVFHAAPGLGGAYMHAWGGPGGAVPISTLTPNTSTISTYLCQLGQGFLPGTSVKIGIKYLYETNSYFFTAYVTVGEPYPVSAASGGDVEVYQGGFISLDDVTLIVTLSNGSTISVTPTSYDQSELDSDKTVGTVLPVTFFYYDGEREVWATVNVKIIEPPDVPQPTALNITKKSADAYVSYGKNTAPDFDSVLNFSVMQSDGQSRTVAYSSGDLTVGEYTPGYKTVKFTYTDSVLNKRVSVETELDFVYTIVDKEDWKLMNTYLDGYFELKDHLNLGGVAETDNPLVIGRVPLKPASEGFEVDATGDGVVGAQIGVPFTGRFNGNGFTVSGFKSDFAANTSPGAAAATSYGLVPFAFVGEGGVVENFTLSGAEVRCGQSGSLLVGLNLGTVKDVVIESNCSLFVNYGGDGTGAIANTNRGLLENITCKVESFIGFGGAQKNFVNRIYDNDGGTEKNCKLAGEVA